jgi:hypothetical protein
MEDNNMAMEGEYVASHSPIFRNPKQYIEAKLKILTDRRSFGIQPTDDEIAHLRTLKTQVQIDNAILSIIDRHWD